MDFTRRNVLKGASALLAAPWLEKAVFSQRSASTPNDSVVDPLSYVNPQFRSLVAKLPANSQTVNAHSLQMARARARSLTPVPLLPGVTEHMIPGPKGAPDVKVYVVGDSAGASKPAILHIHGGGYVLLSGVITKDQVELVKQLDCVIVSVEYRLAPETQFPGSLEDNYAALRWMNENAKQLGIDVTRIAVKGESAGGGHAAMITLAVRERNEFKFCHQVLIYPELDDRTGSTRKLPPYLGHYIWTAESNQFAWTSLLGVPAGSETVPHNSVPARVEDLSGLPPAFIGVGSIDLFALEDIDYSRKLLEAGVPTELMVVPGAYHGFDLFYPQAPLVMQFTNAWTESLRRAFASEITAPAAS